MSIVAEKPEVIKIPEYLVYEIIDGRPIPYRDFQSVLNKKKTLEDIMGSSGLQSLIVSIILRALFKSLSEDKFEIVTNEAGLHLSKKNNLSTDIGIYETAVLKPETLTNKYLEIPPKIAIEVDTKADMSQFTSPMDYYHQKTNKLLEFGTEKVIWITTESKKVMIAAPDQDWLIADWHKPLEILPNLSINIAELLSKRGIQ